MSRQRQAIGDYGERRAAQYLTGSGLHVVERNWRCPLGEIDIIAWDGEVLVFCEVKTRRGNRFGTPAEAVVPAKVRRLRRLAAQWLETSGASPREIRFDVIEVQLPSRGATHIHHLEGAF